MQDESKYAQYFPVSMNCYKAQAVQNQLCLSQSFTVPYMWETTRNVIF